MQRSGIGFPIKVDVCKPYFRKGIVRFKSQYTGGPRFCFRIAPKKPVIPRNPQHQRFNIARIKLHCALKVSRGFFPASLTPLNDTRQLEYPSIVRQRLAGNLHFSQSTFVIAVRPIKSPSTREMRFAFVRTLVKRISLVDGIFFGRTACTKVLWLKWRLPARRCLTMLGYSS